MASWTNAGHGPRLWHCERITTLRASWQEACLEAPRLGKRRGLDLAVQPSQGLIFQAHEPSRCQNRHNRKWQLNNLFDRGRGTVKFRWVGERSMIGIYELCSARRATRRGQPDR